MSMKSITTLACLIGLFCGTVQNVSAQEKVGSSVIDGRPVTLYDDKTWAYSDGGGATTCLYESKALDFCASPGNWTSTPPPNSTIAAQFRRNDRQYAQFIIENIGTDAGLTLTALRTAMIGWAAKAGNIQAKDVPILHTEKVVVDDQTVDFMVYLMNFKGTNVVFANAYLITNTTAYQIMTYEVGASEFTDGHRKTNAEFLMGIKLKQVGE